MEEVTACPVCGAADAVRITDRGKDFDHEAIRACTTCGTFYQSPRLTSDELAAYYRSDAFSEAYRGASSPDDHATAVRGRIADYRIGLLRRLRRLEDGSTLLELGCGAGDFLLRAEEEGLEVFGVDPSTGYAREAKDRGLAVEIGTFPAHHGPRDGYDTIALFHVLEHLPEPRATLAAIDRFLVPDGQLIIEVPDLSRSFNLRWSERYFQRPHLVDYWGPSLRYLLASTGFAISHADYCADQPRRDHHLLVVAKRNRDVTPQLPDPAAIESLIRRVRRRVLLSRLWSPLRALKRS